MINWFRFVKNWALNFQVRAGKPTKIMNSPISARIKRGRILFTIILQIPFYIPFLLPALISDGQYLPEEGQSYDLKLIPPKRNWLTSSFT